MKKTSKDLKEGLLPMAGKAISGAVKTAGKVAGLVPVVGGPIRAAADLAGDATTAILGGEDEEGPVSQLTGLQDEVVKSLAAKKYRVNKVDFQFADEEGGPTVYLSKRPNNHSTRYAEVGPDGLVNGMDVKEFLGHEENEERVITTRTSPTMNESTKITNFLKAIMQKNYAEADKYLESVVNGKIKQAINSALDTNL